MNNTVKTLREYIAKYGDVEKWPLALMFQMLFFILKEQADKETLHSYLIEPIHTLLFKLGQIKNSGVVEEKAELEDKGFNDSRDLVYRCGKYRIKYSAYTTYSRSGIDTECWLTVTRIK